MSGAAAAAFILAGGLGTRLRPIIGDLPKPLAPIAGRPFLAYQIDLLRSRGFTDLVLCTGYRHGLIEACFGDGASLGVRIRYSVESEPLGTGGALRQALAAVRPMPPACPFLVLNGDTYFDGDFARLIRDHQAAGVLCSIALVRKPEAGRYGAVTVGAGGRITRFAEKGESGAGLINAGVYACSPEIAGALPPVTPLSLERDVFPALARQGRLLGCALDGYDMDIDIGTPEGYREFQAWIQGRAPGAGHAP